MLAGFLAVMAYWLSITMVTAKFSYFDMVDVYLQIAATTPNLFTTHG
jgi:hypothetical protein